jgi:predicted DNA-binding transcriptional regulator YafY
MWETSGRLLRLLELFQQRRDWGGAQLAERLAVSERTVRRDVERLRELGYPVDARHGPDGGYRLAPGVSLPPLMFDAEEAVATAIALQALSSSGAEPVAGSSLRALTKLSGVLPDRLRRQVVALAENVQHSDQAPGIGRPPTPVDMQVLVSTALACQERRRITARYAGRDPDRTLDPLGLVHAGRRWYVAAWDLGREDWRTFRLDRLSEVVVTDRPATPREPPGPDLEKWVIGQLGAVMRQRTAAVRVSAPATDVRRWIAPAWGVVEPLDETSCIVRCGADSLASIARWLLLLNADLIVLEPPELAVEFSAIAERASRAGMSTMD